MCGISAVIGTCPCGRVNAARLGAALDSAASRRGPDSTRTTTQHALGGSSFLRLAASVLHLRGDVAARQPACSIDTGDTLLFNGEVFGGVHVERGRSDTDAILELLASAGPGLANVVDALSPVHGPFSFVLHRAGEGALYAGRDVFGRRSLLLGVALGGATSSAGIAAVLASVSPAGAALDRAFSWTELPPGGVYRFTLQDAGDAAAGGGTAGPFDSSACDMSAPSLLPCSNCGVTMQLVVEHAPWPLAVRLRCGAAFGPDASAAAAAAAAETAGPRAAALAKTAAAPAPRDPLLPPCDVVACPALRCLPVPDTAGACAAPSDRAMALAALELLRRLSAAVRVRVCPDTVRGGGASDKSDSTRGAAAAFTPPLRLADREGGGGGGVTIVPAARPCCNADPSRQSKAAVMVEAVCGDEGPVAAVTVGQALAAWGLATRRHCACSCCNDEYAAARDACGSNAVGAAPAPSSVAAGAAAVPTVFAKEPVEGVGGPLNAVLPERAPPPQHQLAAPNTAGCVDLEATAAEQLLLPCDAVRHVEGLIDLGIASQREAAAAPGDTPAALLRRHHRLAAPAPARVAVLYSGGVDSQLLARLAHEHVPPDEAIDLITVCFAGGASPDRAAALCGVEELRTIAPVRRWQLICVDEDYAGGVEAHATTLRQLLYPRGGLMDFNIAAALWHASSGIGFVDVEAEVAFPPLAGGTQGAAAVAAATDALRGMLLPSPPLSSSTTAAMGGAASVDMLHGAVEVIAASSAAVDGTSVNPSTHPEPREAARITRDVICDVSVRAAAAARAPPATRLPTATPTPATSTATSRSFSRSIRDSPLLRYASGADAAVSRDDGAHKLSEFQKKRGGTTVRRAADGIAASGTATAAAAASFASPHDAVAMCASAAEVAAALAGSVITAQLPPPATTAAPPTRALATSVMDANPSPNGRMSAANGLAGSPTVGCACRAPDSCGEGCTVVLPSDAALFELPAELRAAVGRYVNSVTAVAHTSCPSNAESHEAAALNAFYNAQLSLDSGPPRDSAAETDAVEGDDGAANTVAPPPLPVGKLQPRLRLCLATTDGVTCPRERARKCVRRMCAACCMAAGLVADAANPPPCPVHGRGAAPSLAPLQLAPAADTEGPAAIYPALSGTASASLTSPALPPPPPPPPTTTPSSAQSASPAPLTVRVLVRSRARVLLSGIGADEQAGGYGRHRTAFAVGGRGVHPSRPLTGDGHGDTEPHPACGAAPDTSAAGCDDGSYAAPAAGGAAMAEPEAAATTGAWRALRRELVRDCGRLWLRNLGRDDRVCSDSGRELRQPFLDEGVALLLRRLLPVPFVSDPRLPHGVGDKRVVRAAARLAGLVRSAGLVKRAIHFGTRVAQASSVAAFGSNRAGRGTGDAPTPTTLAHARPGSA